MEERALYVRDGDGYVGTVLIQGGWDPGAANGGMVLALLGQCLDEVPTLVPMTVSRFTADLVRPVPLGRRLDVATEVVREGKKIQLVELAVLVDGVEHVRASALRLRDADLTDAGVPRSTTGPRPPVELVGPSDAHRVGTPGVELPGFLGAVAMSRSPHVDGSGTGAWVRLDVPVVAGEPVSATARMAFSFDFGNLIGVEDHPSTVTMINPDVTAQVLRPPVGEWIAVAGDTRVNAAMGRGISSATLSDDDGVFAVVSLSQLIQRR